MGKTTRHGSNPSDAQPKDTADATISPKAVTEANVLLDMLAGLADENHPNKPHDHAPASSDEHGNPPSPQDKKPVHLNDEAPEGIADLTRQLKEINTDIKLNEAERKTAELDTENEWAPAVLERNARDRTELLSQRAAILAQMDALVTDQGKKPDQDGHPANPPAPVPSPLDRPVKPKKPDAAEQGRDRDPYRLAGQPIDKIKAELTKLPGWHGARQRIDRHYKAIEVPVNAEHFLSELAAEVKRGALGVDAKFWNDIYDRYNADGSVIPEAKPNKRGRPKKATRRNIQLRKQPLPARTISSLTDREMDSYDSANVNQSRKVMTSAEQENSTNSETARGDWEAQDLSDDLQDIVDTNDTERFYNWPKDGRGDTQSSNPNAAGTRYQDRARAFAQSRHNGESGDRAGGSSRLRPVETRDAERVGGGTMGNEPWTLDDFGRGRPTPEGDLILPSEPDLPAERPQAGETDQMIDYGPLNPNGPEQRPPYETIDTSETVEVPEYLLAEIPRVPDMEQIRRYGDTLRRGVDTQIRAVSEAKEQREKLFGKYRKNDAELNGAIETLNEAYAGFLNNYAELLGGVENGQLNAIEQVRSGYQSEIDARQEEIARIEASDLPDDVKGVQIREQQVQIRLYRSAQAECDRRADTIRTSMEQMRSEIQQQMILDMAQTRNAVETAQAELKEGSMVQRFKNMWRKHPVARLAIGAGLAGVGFFIGGPVGSAAMLGGVAMRGMGGYMGTEGGYNWLRRRRADKRTARDAEASYTNTDLGARGEARAFIDSQVNPSGEYDARDQAIDQFVKENADALFGQDMIRRVLNGETRASAELTGQLLEAQMERLKGDAKHNRRAKVAGVMVGAGLSALGLLRFMDRPGGARPGDTRPGGTDTSRPYNPNFDRMAGIRSTSSQAGENWDRMIANTTPEQIAASNGRLDALNNAYEQVSGGMSRAQLSQLNRIIGIGSTTQFGNEGMLDKLPAIATQVRNGLPTEKILENFNLPQPTA